MPLYAIYTSGPIEQPNAKFVVEILDQGRLIDFFVCKNLETNEIIETHLRQLRLTWITLTSDAK